MSSPDRTTAAVKSPTTLMQLGAIAVGVVFLVLGVLGFIPGVTTKYGQLDLGGPDSNAQLFGVFTVSWLHNALHLAFGLAGLLVARSFVASRIYLIAGGIGYILLFGWGLAVGRDSPANMIPLDEADNWLHVGAGAIMIILAAALSTWPPKTTDVVPPSQGGPTTGVD